MKPKQQVWKLAFILIPIAIALTLSSAWTEITIDNETYWLVPDF